MSTFPPPLKADLKAGADQFWKELDSYLKQVSPADAEELKKKFTENHRQMVQKSNLDDLEEITKNIFKYLHESEMYSQSASSQPSFRSVPPPLDSQQRES